MLTLDEAARFLRLDPQVVAELARSQGLPGRYVDRQWRFARAALLDWLRGDALAGAGLGAKPPAASAPSAQGASMTASPRSSAANVGAATVPDGVAAATRARGTQEEGQRVSASTPETVGEKPGARTAEETALRDQGALLPAKQTMVEFGMSYARSERQSLGLLRVEQNAAAATLAVRYGLRDELQVSARLPLTYRRTATTVAPSLGESTQTSNTYTGDLSTSLVGIAARERSGRPTVVVSGDVVLPTGPGDRGLGAGVVLSKSFDPVVLFAGASYMRGFHVEGSDPRRALGEHNLGFNFGYAYAVNDSVALSGVFVGSYKRYARSFAPTGLAPSRENYQLQLGATLQLGRGLFIEPSVGVGVGGAAPDVTLSVNIPYTF